MQLLELSYNFKFHLLPLSAAPFMGHHSGSSPHLERSPPPVSFFFFFFLYFAVNHRVTVGGRVGVIADDDLGLTVLILVSITCFLFGLF